MIDLNDRRILSDGTVICSTRAILDMIYSGRSLDGVIAEPNTDVQLHNVADRLLDTNYGEIILGTDGIYGTVDWHSQWTTPDHWLSIDIERLCLDRCDSDAEQERVRMEMIMFRERNMEPVLRHLVYLVDHWRSNGVLWGVGRGSSVSSLVLFLIGINRINPMEFDLDIREFLK
jgi:DNA polymerase III alpha subunit